MCPGHLRLVSLIQKDLEHILGLALSFSLYDFPLLGSLKLMARRDASPMFTRPSS